MLSDLPSVKFDIHEKVKLSNEDLSFKNLASLDLQPIVKVNDNKKEVEITGHLVLNGEFIVKNQYWEDQLDQFDALNYDTLLSNEYKVDSFQHQIPLSIQVNNNRVENISNVIVQVDEFDYEVLSNQEIELIAQIKLIGIKPENFIEPLENDSEVDYYNILEEQVQGKETIKDYEKHNFFDNDYENEYPLKAIYTNEVNIPVDTTLPEKNEEIQSVVENNNTSIKPKLGITAKVDKNNPNFLNPIYSLLKKGQKEIKEIVQSNPEENIPNSDSISNNQEKELPIDTIDTIEDTLPTIEEIEDNVAIVRSNSKVNKDNILFGLLQGDETQSYKLKLYLVQKDDTIKKIADKYGLSSEDIISKNNITSQDLRLGQLLYLPVKR